MDTTEKQGVPQSAVEFPLRPDGVCKYCDQEVGMDTSWFELRLHLRACCMVRVAYDDEITGEPV